MDGTGMGRWMDLMIQFDGTSTECNRNVGGSAVNRQEQYNQLAQNTTAYIEYHITAIIQHGYTIA